jgi:hypothetical protein
VISVTPRGVPRLFGMAMYELAKRREAGLLVRLLWDSGRDQAVIRYVDDLEADRFVADVPNGRALDAFYHPNAYRPRELTAAAA